ncbi:MAG: hypothetical protein Unbinned3065contig1002_2 [Prokaryotic dsDNA virus sp.]|nr:MAG: hypothetical protein Unbinned3065contig1002_2 [Prokaryotic dsDNA virus sp.]|tara:strand:+ start:12416 stop:14263 length:1848 start_codon:yes stop_codon:yes gene_type:complete
MTVASTDARTGPYDGNGSTTTFAYDFLVLDQAHLVVTVKTTSTGVEVVKTLTTHYSVTGVGTASGGNIVFTSASTHAPSGTTVTITRSVPMTQTTDLQNRGGVQPETLETGYDKLTQIDQDQQGEIDRSLKFAVSADLSSFNTSVPAPVASKAIIINSSNNGFELVDEPSASATSATASAATATTQATLATNYATKVDGAVTGTDFSSKAWAIGGTGVTDTAGKGAAKEWATEAEDNTVDGSGYSALHWAAKAEDHKDTATTKATEATNYATKVDGAVTGSDFSAKAWAVGGTNVTTTASRGAAKEWATTTGGAVDTSEYSAKEYAVGSTVAAGSAKEWALGGGGSFTEGTAVAGGLYSARKYATDAATEAAAATAYNKKWTAVTTLTAGTHNLERANVGTYYVLNASGGTITINLPTIGTGASDALDGQMFGFEVTNVDNAITIVRDGDTINGAASNYTGLTAVGHVVHFIADEVAATETDNWLATIMSCNDYGAGLTQTGTTITLDLTKDQSWTGSQRSTPVTDNDGSFDMNAGNNFNWTPSGADVIEFTNETAGQGGLIYLVNGSGHTITKGSEVKCDANFLATVSTAGNYLISYYSFDGTSVVVANTLAVS